MAKLNKDDVLKTIIKSANLYKKNLVNKNFLIVSKNRNEPYNFWELIFEKKQFLHLVGVKTNLSSKHFYTKATTKKLSINDFEPRTDGTTELKLAVLPTLMEFKNSVRMIGHYLEDCSPRLLTEVLAGNVRGALGFVPDEKSDLVPNTCLSCNTKVRSNSARIVLMLSKNFSDKEYSTIEYIAKDNFNIDELKEFDSPFKEIFNNLFDDDISDLVAIDSENLN